MEEPKLAQYNNLGSDKLPKPKIYLPGPITGCTNDEKYLWRKYIKLKYESEFDFTDPIEFGDWECGGKIIESIQLECHKAIKECTAVVAKMSRNSVGTAMGIFLGWWLGKYVVTICDKEKWPLLQSYSDVLASDEDEAIKWLKLLISPMEIPRPPGRRGAFGFDEIIKLVRIECIEIESDPAICGKIIKQISEKLTDVNSTKDDVLEWTIVGNILNDIFQKNGLSLLGLKSLSTDGYYNLEKLKENLNDKERKLGDERERTSSLREENYELRQQIKRLKMDPEGVNEPIAKSIYPAKILKDKGYTSIHIITSYESSIKKLVEWLGSEDDLKLTRDIIENSECLKCMNKLSKQEYIADILVYEWGNLKHIQDFNLSGRYRKRITGQKISNIFNDLKKMIGN